MEPFLNSPIDFSPKLFTDELKSLFQQDKDLLSQTAINSTAMDKEANLNASGVATVTAAISSLQTQSVDNNTSNNTDVFFSSFLDEMNATSLISEVPFSPVACSPAPEKKETLVPPPFFEDSTNNLASLASLNTRLAIISSLKLPVSSQRPAPVPVVAPRPAPMLTLPDLSVFRQAKLPPVISTQKKQVLMTSAVPTPTPIVETSTTSRNWRVISKNSQVVKDETAFKALLKSRRENSAKSSEEVPERLFSSIRYEMHPQVPKEALTLTPATKFLLAKLQIVDFDTVQEIRKSNGTMIIDGTHEAGMLLNQSKDCFEADMKFGFTDVSFHHARRAFAFKVSYYLSNELESPILEKISPTFLVLARKPKKPKKTTTSKAASKRKRDAEESKIPEKPAKVQKTQESITDKASLVQFEQKLGVMLQSFEKLDQQEKSSAIAKILSVLANQKLPDQQDAFAPFLKLMN